MAEAPCLTLQNATITFGGTPLFSNLSLYLAKGQRAALVGRNGCGKSTLLRALAGVIELDKGLRFLQPGYTVSYLPQEVVLPPLETVLDYVLSDQDPKRPVEIHEAEAALDQLSLSPTRALQTLSGGEIRRAGLARTLMLKPEVMLLDEPTNHLDIGTIEWLEKELRGYRGALLLISHDRSFLETVTTDTFWMDRGQLRWLNRGYKHFEAWSEEVLEQEEKELARLNKKLTTETEWLHKGVTARRKRNQGRLRRLITLRESKRQYIGPKGRVQVPPSTAESESRLVLEAKEISKTFDTVAGPLPIVKDFSLRLLKGDRIGIIGNNGTGKTTLVKLLLGELPVDNGSLRQAKNLSIAYCDQNRISLKPHLNLWETLCDNGGDQVMVQGKPRHVVAYLRDFLFDEKKMFNAVGTLSGGERNRLMLAKALTQPSILLVLDEPTNDLDMDTLDVLEEILSDYEGTLIVVSHDRDFLDRLVTSIVAVEGQGNVHEYVGGYTDYLRQKMSHNSSTKPAILPKAKTPDNSASSSKPQTKLSYHHERELELLTQKIPDLAARKEKIEEKLTDANLFERSPNEFKQIITDLEQTKQELDAAEERWLELESLKETLRG